MRGAESLADEFVRLLDARTGHFRLESGHHGELWLDLDRLFLRPRRLEPFVGELAGRLSGYDVDAVCGPLVGGAFLAQSLAARLDVECYYSERYVPPSSERLYAAAYRIPSGLAAGLRGRRIAVVDDVVNAGSAVRGTIAALRAGGAEPVTIAALLVLGPAAANLAAAEHVTIETIAQLPNTLWPPADCPLCAAGAPLDDLVR